jgi:uncharacterized protein with von Willebrand factor type A (vWA) domain
VEPLIKHQTTLSANVVLLCRFLRVKSFEIGPAEEADALKAISYVPINSEYYFREALKTVLSKNAYQRSKFDEYYAEFKDQLSKASDSKVKEKANARDNKSEAQKKEAQFESLKNWLNLNPSTDEKQVSSYSHLEVLTRKNFLDLSEDEMRLMMRLLRKMARKLAHQKSRLKKRSKTHKGLDLKGTIRANMRKGGEIQHLIFSKKKERKLKLVLLCDVSRSMDLYSRFFFNLIYCFN